MSRTEWEKKGFASSVLALFFALFAPFSLPALCAPAAQALEGVRLDVRADTPVIEAGKPANVVVRALVSPPRETAETARAGVPLAVAIVLDKSGSMGSDRKMENARLGALEALDRLDARDVATVVVYDSEARVLVPPRPAGEKAAFRRAIMGAREGGSTALYDGIRLGGEALRPWVSEGYAPRIVMLSDGQANVGPSSTRELAELGRRLSRDEMTITTIGLGLDYNEDLMTALAAESGGNAYFAKNADALTDIFARDMKDAVALSARTVRVTIECGADVTPVRVIGRDGELAGNTLTASIDNLYGADKYALFEIEAPGTSETRALDVAVVKLEYVDPATGRTRTQRAPLRLTLAEDAGEVERNRDAEIVAQTALAKNAEAREEAVRLADEGRAKEAAQLLQRQREALLSLPAEARAAAPEIGQDAESFESLAQDMEATGSMSNEQRKQNLNKAYIEKTQQSKVD